MLVSLPVCSEVPVRSRTARAAPKVCINRARCIFAQWKSRLDDIGRRELVGDVSCVLASSVGKQIILEFCAMPCYDDKSIS